MGITLNDTQLTTQIYNVTPANVLAMSYSPGAFGAGPLNECCSVAVHLMAGDVLRAHNDINCNSSLASFHVTKVAVQTNSNSETLFISSPVTTSSSAVSSGTFTTFSNSPAFTFTPTVTGKYKVYSSAIVDCIGANQEYDVRIFNTTGGGTLLAESKAETFTSSTEIVSSLYAQSVYTLTAGTSYVFDIQGRASGGSLTLFGSVASFYMFAELCKSNAGGGSGVSTLNSLTGALNITAGSGITVTPSGSNIQIAATGGNLFDRFASSQVTGNSSNITGTSFTTFSNSPAFTFTPNFTGTYKVYCSVPLVQGTSSVTAVARIISTSGSPTLLQESQAAMQSGSNEVSILIESVYTLTSGSPYVFDIQGKNLSTGTLSINGFSANFYMFAERIG